MFNEDRCIVFKEQEFDMNTPIKLYTSLEEELYWFKRVRTDIKEVYIKDVLWKETFCHDDKSKDDFLTKVYVKLQEADIPIHFQSPITKGDGNCLVYCFLIFL